MFTCYWICSFNRSQMFQFYFKEKFDVLRMFRLLVRCNSIWFYLLYLFIQYLKRIIHQSFVSTAPTYGDSRGIAGVRCCTITFRLFPQYRGSVGVITLGHLPCWDFLMRRVRQRAGLLPSACPHRAGLIPGLWKVKFIIPAHPRRWGSSGYK